MTPDSDSITRTPVVLLIPLAEATDPSLTGQKAAGLARLIGAGVTVPDGFVVPGSADILSAPFAEALTIALTALGGRVAVRSSSTVEDLADSSFAGIFETFLNVEGTTAVIDAIDKVRASGSAERVSVYAREHAASQTSTEMGVVIQKMVPAEAAGVVFTADPLSGDRTTAVVSAVAGLADRLVSGEADEERWTVTASGATRQGGGVNILTEAQARKVAELGRTLEDAFGFPLDVEWALVGEEINLLQARPMTALPEAVSWEPPLPGAWVRDFRLGEWLGAPVTPLFESWGLPRIERASDGKLAGSLRMAPPEVSHVVINGWYFYGFNFLPSNPLEMIWHLVRYLIPAFVTQPRRASMALPPLARFGIGLAEDEFRSDVLPNYVKLVDEATAELKTNLEPMRVVQLLDELLEGVGTYFASITMVGGFAFKSELPLAKFYREHLHPIIGGSHLDLMVGLGEGPRRLGDHALLSIDWSEPTLGELGVTVDPEAARRRHAAAQASRADSEARAYAALESKPKLATEFRRLMEVAQRYALIREEQVAVWSIAWPVMKDALRRIGEVLVGTGVLSEPQQIHFLTRSEVESGLRGDRTDLATPAADRRSSWARHSNLVPPLRLGTIPPLFEKLLAQAEEAIRGPIIPGDSRIIGIPASPGRATGPVRVVHSPGEFGKVRPGDILVSPVTAPAWTPLFDRIAAVVTNTGGVAAHASIVAREYGLPAVVGTGDATSRLHDGTHVEVDGTRGMVTVLDSSHVERSVAEIASKPQPTG